MSLTPQQAVDHIILAVPDLKEATENFYRVSGVLPSYGGQHKGRGTHNALVSLGPTTYLELLAPDPQQQDVDPKDRFLKETNFTVPYLFTWVMKTDNIGSLKEQVKVLGYDLGETIQGDRTSPQGDTLIWEVTTPNPDEGGIIPFLIDWKTTPPHIHPSRTAPAGCSLQELRFYHPQHHYYQKILTALGINAIVQYSEVPELVAVINTPKGSMELGGRNRICFRKGNESDLQVMIPIYLSLGWITPKPEDLLFIGEINTSPIAFGRLIPLGENKYEISGVYVKETLRGRGYGRRLVQFILNSIKETDIIYCVPFKHLINFYTSFGWRETLTEDEKLQLPQQIKEKVQWCNCKFTDQCTLLILKKSMTI